MDSPLLMPTSQVYASRKPVRLLDSDGTIVCLPFHLNITFCKASSTIGCERDPPAKQVLRLLVQVEWSLEIRPLFVSNAGLSLQYIELHLPEVNPERFSTLPSTSCLM